MESEGLHDEISADPDAPRTKGRRRHGLRTGATMTTVVVTEALSKYYGQSRGVVDLDLSVRSGEVFGFIGPNGAGKTTTIRLLLDFIRPTSGTARVFGLDVNRKSIEIRKRIGYVPGDLQLFERLTPVELYTWLGRLRDRHDPDRALQLSERLSLDPTRPIGELSTGNRQKVAIVQAFMHQPDLLILDEPMSGLDPLVRRSFRQLVDEEVAKGATVFLSSHVLAEVEDMCDRVGMVVNGRLRRVDRVSDLQAWSRRRVRLTIVGRPDVAAFARLPAVDRVVELPARNADGPIGLELDITGDVDGLIKELSRYRVLDLISEPLSLEDIFLESFDDHLDGDLSPGRELSDVD